MLQQQNIEPFALQLALQHKAEKACLITYHGL